MSNLRLSIAETLLQKFPEMTVVAFTAVIDDQEILRELPTKFSGQLTAASDRISATEPITQLEEIAVWRQAYGAMSIKPSKFHSSVEALLRRVKKGDDISTGLPAVDAYNLMSVIHGAPMGAYDLEKLGEGGIELRLADPQADHFEPLGGRPDSFPLNEDLAVYADGNHILCWGINTRDSARSCVTETSRTIVFLSEAVSESGHQRSRAALQTLAAELTGLGLPTGAIQTANRSSAQITV